MCDITLPSDLSRSTIDQLIKEHHFENVDICISSGSEKGDNYVGDIYRIKIVSKLDGRSLLNLILKTNPPNDPKGDSIPLEVIYGRESDVYNEISPAFEMFQKIYNIPDGELFKHAKCFKANNQLLLLEDLSVKGFEMYNRFNSYDENHLALVITTLARLHAISFAMKEKQPDTIESLIKLVEKSVVGDFFHPMLEGVVPKTLLYLKDDEKIEKLKKFSENIVSKYYSFVGPSKDHPYNVICHGDCWSNNLLFKYEDNIPTEAIFLDWQVTRYGSPVSDVTHMIYCSTDKTTRDKFGSKIFDLYYEALANQLQKFECSIDKCYPHNVFESHIKEFWPYGLLMSLIAIPIILSKKGNDFDVKDMVDYSDGQEKLQYGNIIVERLEDIIDEFISLKMI